MKKISELMEELGFDPKGSPAVKEAFIKYLVKTSTGTSVLTPTEKTQIKADPTRIKVLPEKKKPEQLAFDFHKDTEPKSKFLLKRTK